MCDECKWNQYIDDPEFGRHKECCCPPDVSCPMEDMEKVEYEGDSAYDRALAAGLHPTEIPEEWRHI